MIGFLLTMLFLPANAQTPREKWIAVADRLAATDAASYPFDWGEGVQMSGLMQVYGRTKTEKYADFVARWADTHASKGSSVLMNNHADAKGWKGYCGRWVSGTALLYLYEARKDQRYLQIASEIANFVRAGAARGPEGALAHYQGNFQIWVDTLNMSCPLLSRLSKAENKPWYLEDAVDQLLSAARHMRDARTGLFYHMWDWQFERLSAVQWGRGNGWVTMSLADVFEYLPKNNPRYGELQKMAKAHADALLRVQDGDGVWHTIMNDLTSPAESSATTMVAYGLLKMVRLGALPAKYRAPALKAWNAVNEKWVKDGVVTGISQGTAPANAEAYLNRKVGTYTWGVGSYLMAGTEVDRLGRARR